MQGVSRTDAHLPKVATLLGKYPFLSYAIEYYTS